MNTKLLIFAAVLFLVGCSESQNPVSGIIESEENNITTISGNNHTIIKGIFDGGNGHDTIYFQANQYNFHSYMIESDSIMGKWTHNDNLRIYFETGMIILPSGKNGLRYRILLFQ